VLRGESGIGKSALLEYAAAHAEGCHVLRAAGAEWEMELPFARLHQLCMGLLDGLECLPKPQRDALGTAFGLISGARPDRFLVGLAALSLLADAAEEHPLVCVVDDVQWLDRSSAQVLAFVARRLEAESVVLLLAEREPGELAELAGLPELRLRGLPDDSARELLASVISAPLDERVRDRLIAEAHGNPLALLELPRDFSPGELAGGFGLPGDRSLPRRIEASFHRRVSELPSATQRLLLVAAADPTGEPALLFRAAGKLGIPTEELAPAQADGLLELGLGVAFRHSLLRSAIYRSAPAEERRSVHRALAEVTDAELDPDRRAWHSAHATVGPDEDIAGKLEESADRARARGGLAAAAAFLERAVVLTADQRLQARRALEAAAAKLLAGDAQSALNLLTTAAAGTLDEEDRAKLKRLHGQILLDLRRAAEAIPDLVDAAKQLEAIDPGLARDTYSEAVRAASVAGRLGPGMFDVAKAARTAPPRPGGSQPADLLLDGLAVRFTEGYAASAPLLMRALSAVRAAGDRADPDVRWPWAARRLPPELFDDEAWHAQAVRNIDIACDAGALALLPLALNNLALLRCFEGELTTAAELVEEADEITEATRTAPIVFGKMLLAGCRGDEGLGLAMIESSESAARERTEGVVLTFGEHARALLHNGLSQHAAALAPARSASARDELMVSVLALPELVEAAARSGRIELAAEAVERVAECTRAVGTEWAFGLEARCRALLSERALAERLYQEAIDRLGRTRVRMELARAHLLYGEWLRRGRRRVDARDQLRSAWGMFSSMGATAFAARAERELLATGETARKRTTETRDDLTPQERQIAELACNRLSNREIDARLFISPRTVEYHLHKIFNKLDVSSRGQLASAFAITADRPNLASRSTRQA
jgi:DNA-binding CsgD family transcriptional regulator/tetratricopeptide (TPR) repeat protein